MEKEEAKTGGKTVYELGYLILPSIAEDKLASVVASLKKTIQAGGGVEIDGEEPFKTPLAYTMYKTVGASHYVVNEAYLGWIKFDLPAEALAQEGAQHPIVGIKADVEKINEILRFLLIKAPRKSDFTFAKARAKSLEAETPSADEDDTSSEAGVEDNNESSEPKEKEVVVE